MAHESENPAQTPAINPPAYPQKQYGASEWWLRPATAELMAEFVEWRKELVATCPMPVAENCRKKLLAYS